MSAQLERRLLQILVLAGGIVPVAAGGWGVLGRIPAGGQAVDSHVRYLSGLLLAIGFCFWSCAPDIARRGTAIRMLGFIVVVGGLARLVGALETVGGSGLPPGVALPLVMELGVTPAVVLWQARVARRAA
jgi:hypothetical protein